jgi:hypothetical protein
LVDGAAGSAVPFAAATLGVAVYRFLTIWLPLPGALLSIPKLRELGQMGEDTSDTAIPAAKREPALEH